jgi:hypothetical protein
MTDLTAAVDRLIGVSLAAGSALGRQAGPDQQLTRDFEAARADLLALLAAFEARTAKLEAVAGAAKEACGAYWHSLGLSYKPERHIRPMSRLNEAIGKLAALDGPDAAEGEAGT